MKALFLLACAIMALPLHAQNTTPPKASPLRQTSTPATSSTAQPTDPSAPVLPVVYQSVFANVNKGVEMQSVDWKKANADVGQFKRGHIDILKWENAQPATSTSPGTHPHPSKP